MSSINLQINIKGKLLDINANKNMAKAINKGIEKMMLVTEDRTKARTPVRTGHLRRSITGQLIGNLSAQVDAGQISQGQNVVYADWIEGISARNSQTGYAGASMFRLAAKELENEDKSKYFAEPIKDNLT